MTDDNPRQEQIERALEGFYAHATRVSVQAGRVPRRRRYHRVIGGVVGEHQHQRRKRQRRQGEPWRVRRERG